MYTEYTLNRNSVGLDVAGGLEMYIGSLDSCEFENQLLWDFVQLVHRAYVYRQHELRVGNQEDHGDQWLLSPA